MSNGALVFAHNNRRIDYARMAIISGGLAKKNLNVPVSLISDISTIEWMKKSEVYSKAEEVFEKIICVDRPDDLGNRILFDGPGSKEIVPFNNSNRVVAFQHSPYEKTLLIDSDFLILSDRLKNYWDLCEDILISKSAMDIFHTDRMKHNDEYISETSIKMRWATAIMFSKSEKSKTFFDLVDEVKENYKFYGDVYRYDTRQYRNDISFSIANHILSGFTEIENNFLPSIFTTLDKDILVDVEKNKLKILFSDLNDFVVANFSGVDIHIMNKHSLVRNYEKLLELI